MPPRSLRARRHFDDPVICPSKTPGASPTTFFFGLTSKFPPKPVDATLVVNGSLLHVPARAPAHS